MGTEHLTLGGACRQGKTYLPEEGGCKSERFFAPTWWDLQIPGAPVRSNGSRASPRVEGEPPRPVRSNGSRASPRTEGWLGLRKEGRTRWFKWFESLTTNGSRASPRRTEGWFESLTTNGSDHGRAAPAQPFGRPHHGCESLTTNGGMAGLAEGGPHPPSRSDSRPHHGWFWSGRRAAPAQSFEWFESLTTNGRMAEGGLG